ncbi:hypothetical protein BCR37DRAFT_266623 [Protomyces lactucae-debilis]|uniref:MPN domain-containing protein n=1 Tax=Protomyces lactucae-debilis TaxID=2754530 RepID=A0A1Y2FKD8_PROLT|nr:uncharacterized protein BCR37DRAFT_266623 [Protomyces lactucae-debilis]ORY84420.1 hypothetical protein BCR37DRAFT_266623 [Protomyces lactucae-debilis]
MSAPTKRAPANVLSRKILQERAIAGLQASWNPQARLQLWFRAFERIRREAETVHAEGDVQQAYMLLLRCVELVVTYMPTHPQAREPEHRRQLVQLNATVERMLQTLAELKRKVDDAYAVQEAQAKKDAADKAQAMQKLALAKRQRELEQRAQEQSRRSSGSNGNRTDIMQRLAALREAHHLGEEHVQAVPLTPIVSSTAALNEPDVPSSISPGHPAQLITKTSNTYNFSASAQLENGTELRTVFVPGTLRDKFLSIAASNTSRNLETCGILSGIVKANAYFVTHLIIPAQESTSDTCHTTDEVSLFTYQDEHDLFTLGWIHTHPTQTCFMSSVDIHTHMSYQVMLPEAIAIVLSPSKQPDWGVFRLTDPPGMQAVKNCRQTGLFHPHDETNIYTDALHEVGSSVGHMKEMSSMAFSVVDQR